MGLAVPQRDCGELAEKCSNLFARSAAQEWHEVAIDLAPGKLDGHNELAAAPQRWKRNDTGALRRRGQMLGKCG